MNDDCGDERVEVKGPDSEVAKLTGIMSRRVLMSLAPTIGTCENDGSVRSPYHDWGCVLYMRRDRKR